MSKTHAPEASFPGAWLRFVRGFLANPQIVASIMPSSKCLQNQISSRPCIQSAEFVVELGPGTGEITQALLSQMPRRSRLMCIEIVPEFVDHLRQIRDPRLSVLQGNAFDVGEILREQNLPMPDTVVSGIPFSTISAAEGRKLIQTIHNVLAPQGAFLAYQFRDRISELANEVFGEPQTSLVYWNIPPLRVSRWQKSSDRMPIAAPVHRAPASPVNSL